MAFAEAGLNDAAEIVAAELASFSPFLAFLATGVHLSRGMYGRILRQIRESKGRSQADVAREVAISAAHLARLETEQRGLYVEDFVRIAEALGEKPGNLLPNDVGAFGHLKPVVDQLARVRPEFLPYIVAILQKVMRLAEAARDPVCG